MAQAWALSQGQRDAALEGLALGLRALAEVRGRKIAEETALEKAKEVEKKAHVAAQVESKTTTGRRPDAQTLQIYARKAGQLVIQYVNDLASATDMTPTTAPSVERVEGLLDISGGEREFLTVESATEKLQPILDSEGKYTLYERVCWADPHSEHLTGHTSKCAFNKIKLSTKSFGIEAAAVAAKAITMCRDTLKELDLSDIIASRPEDEALQALQCISAAITSLTLTELDLSDNALGEKGVRACTEALTSQSSLEALSFKNVGCSPEACQAIAELISCKESLRKLHLHNNMSDNAGAAAIADLIKAAPRLEDFMMVSSRVKQEGGQALANALMGKTLSRLDLSDNILGPETAEVLGVALQSQSNLKYLNLSETCLEDEGVVHIANGLMRIPSSQLEVLELAANEITHEAAISLALALADKKNLKVLNLKENELGDKGAIAIASVIKLLSGLETIDMYQNEIGKAGSIALIDSLESLENLKAFDLNSNYIPEDTLEEIEMKVTDIGLTCDFDENEADMGEDDLDEEEVKEFKSTLVDQLASRLSNL